MWLDPLMLYLWLLLWAPGPPMGSNNPHVNPDGATISGYAQGMNPNVGNQAPGPNGYHCAYQGNSGNAPPNQGTSGTCGP